LSSISRITSDKHPYGTIVRTSIKFFPLVPTQVYCEKVAGSTRERKKGLDKGIAQKEGLIIELIRSRGKVVKVKQGRRERDITDKCKKCFGL